MYLGTLLTVVHRATGGEVGLGVGAVLDEAAAWRGLKIYNGATVSDLLGQATLEQFRGQYSCHHLSEVTIIT